MHKIIFSSFIAIFTLGLTPSAFANNMTNAQITADTMAALPQCVHYQVIGTCVWASPHGINTTPYIQHYLPDLVVSTFNQENNNAWIEMRQTLDVAAQPLEQQIVQQMSGFAAGSGQHSLHNVHEQQVFFYQSEVIGNPTVALIAKNNPFLLPSTAQPLQPYFQSMLDAAAWRGFPQLMLPEETYAFGADILHHVGTGLINWGGIYPHEGKITSGNPIKAAAVISQRATDLLTSQSQFANLHVHQTLSTHCGQVCRASRIQENNPHTQFQLIYPVAQTTCAPLGQSASLGDGDDISAKAQGAYVWVVWRFYHGCRDGDGQLIGIIKFKGENHEQIAQA